MTDMQPDVMQDDMKPQFTCEVCGASFKSKLGLGIHRGRTHGAKSAEPLDGNTVDTTRLLKALFPDGNVPVGKLERVQAWLDEARALRG